MAFIRILVAQAPQAHARLLAEFVASGIPVEQCPGPGAVESALKDPNNFIFRDTDDPRVSVWALRETGHRCERNPNSHAHIFVRYVFAASANHGRTLVRICDEMIARGFGSLLISYSRSGAPLTVIADNSATTPGEIETDSRTVTTTATQARTRLLTAGYTA